MIQLPLELCPNCGAPMHWTGVVFQTLPNIAHFEYECIFHFCVTVRVTVPDDVTYTPDNSQSVRDTQ